MINNVSKSFKLFLFLFITMGLKSIFSKLFAKIISKKDSIILADKIVTDIFWKESLKYLGMKKVWNIITPANFNYCKIVYNLNLKKEEFSEILRKRITFLIENNEEIQLSLFLGKAKEFLDDGLQKKKFQEALEFMLSLNLNPTKLLIIDNVYNKLTINLARQYGFKELINQDIHLITPLLKIVKKIGLNLSFVKNLYEFLIKSDFKSIIYLILGEFINVKEKTIHIETFIRNDVWESLKKEIIGKNYTWFVITPSNFEYCKTYFNIGMNKNDFSTILIDRLNYLKSKREKIHLHIHLSKDFKFLNKELQKEKFEEAIEFLNSLKIKPSKFVAGWWIFNRDTIKLAKKYGIKVIYSDTINPFLKEMIFDGIIIKFVHKYWHDFDFI